MTVGVGVGVSVAVGVGVIVAVGVGVGVAVGVCVGVGVGVGVCVGADVVCVGVVIDCQIVKSLLEPSTPESKFIISPDSVYKSLILP